MVGQYLADSSAAAAVEEGGEDGMARTEYGMDRAGRLR